MISRTVERDGRVRRDGRRCPPELCALSWISVNDATERGIGSLLAHSSGVRGNECTPSATCADSTLAVVSALLEGDHTTEASTVSPHGPPSDDSDSASRTLSLYPASATDPMWIASLGDAKAITLHVAGSLLVLECFGMDAAHES